MPDALALPQLAGGSVLTIGTFDGVHRGHREILRRLVERGRAAGLPTALITFRPHPLSVIRPESAPALLTPGDEQLDMLADSAIDHVVVLPFTQTLAAYTAAEFVDSLLRRRYAMREFVIGYNHRLGRGREGDSAALEAIGAARGFRVDVVPPTIDASGTPVSSSRIRTLIREGDLDRVSEALGRRYAVRGAVVHGSHRGRDLGYPTINIALPNPKKLLPPDGVYAVRATTPRGVFGGMMNLGGRPTFDEHERTIETHLFDASGDWYGTQVLVEFVSRLRDTVKFGDAEALVAQLARDSAAAHIALTQAQEPTNVKGSANRHSSPSQ
jgi:riboflavin kinase / FMN adenylyltransferase